MLDKHKLQIQCFMTEHAKYDVDQAIIDAYKKAGDKNPVFKFFGISAEGECSGELAGHGKQVTRYAKSIINKLHTTLKKGIKAFLGHDTTTPADDRVQVGEIIGSTLEDNDGTLEQVACIYIHPDHRDRVLDVASIETIVHCVRSEDDTAYDVVNVAPITGIALGDGTVDQPGFEKATLRAQLAAFAKESENEMTLEEIMAYVLKNGTKPSEVFTKAVLAKDSTVEDLMKAHSQKEFDHRKRVEEKLESEQTRNTELVKNLDTSKTALSEANGKIGTTLSKEMFDTLMEENEYAGKTKQYIEKKFKTFLPGEFEGEKDLKKKVGVFITEQATEAKEIAELFGHELSDDKSGVDGDDGSGTSGKEDMTKPENNSLINTGV